MFPAGRAERESDEERMEGEGREVEVVRGGGKIEAEGAIFLPNQLTRHSIISPLGRRVHMKRARVNMPCAHTHSRPK